MYHNNVAILLSFKCFVSNRRDKKREKVESKSKPLPHEMAAFGKRESLWFGDAYEQESNMDISM